MSENFIACKEGCHPVGGYCDQPGQCQCNSGWSGTNCSVPDCLNECQNVLVMYLITVSVMMDGVE